MALCGPLACAGAAFAVPGPWLAASLCAAAVGGAVGVAFLRQTLRRCHLSITELTGRLAEEAAEVEHTQALIDNMLDAVITTDAAGTIDWCNPATGAMFGCDPAMLRGRPCSTLLANAERTAPLTAMCAPEPIGVCSDGSTFPLDVAVGTLQVGERPLVLLVLRDASARRKAEADRIQAQKLESIGVLVAGIAHEIGTPLQYVGNQIDFLDEAFRVLQPSADAEAVRSTCDPGQLEFVCGRVPRALQHVRQGLDQVARIVAGLRNYAHPGGSSRRSCFDLNAVIRDAIEITRNRWKNVARLDASLDASPAEIWGHAGELMQVVVNLIVNASDAILERRERRPGDGQIRVATHDDAGQVVLVVTDDGCGIAPDVRDRVFDLFFTTKPAGKGTGQGLAVAHSVVRAHGGHIGCEATADGGTRFVVRLPVHWTPDAEEVRDAQHLVRR